MFSHSVRHRVIRCGGKSGVCLARKFHMHISSEFESCLTASTLQNSTQRKVLLRKADIKKSKQLTPTNFNS